MELSTTKNIQFFNSTFSEQELVIVKKSKTQLSRTKVNKTKLLSPSGQSKSLILKNSVNKDLPKFFSIYKACVKINSYV